MKRYLILPIVSMSLLASCTSTVSSPSVTPLKTNTVDFQSLRDDFFDLDMDKYEDSPTPVPSITPAPTITPTATPTLQPPILPPLPKIVDRTNYGYSTPSSMGLIDMLQLANDQFSYANNLSAGGESEYVHHLRSDASWLIRVLGLKVQLHYPDGFPDPSLLLEREIEADGWPIYPDAYLDLLADILLQDIQAGNYELEDEALLTGDLYEVIVFRVELDHDAGPEWLFQIAWRQLGVLTWLLLDENPGSHYSELEAGLPSDNWLIGGLSDRRIEAHEDFTGDGLTDIIYLRAGYASGTDWGTFYIAQGAQEGFKIIDEEYQSIAGYLSSGLMFEVGKPIGSRWLNLTIIDPHSLNWGCYWQTYTSMSWPFGNKQTTIRDEDPPNSADCYLAQAVHLRNTPDVKTAISLLERAISLFNTSDPEQHAKSLFAHFRLSMLYGLEGQYPAAILHFKQFLGDYTGSQEFMTTELNPILDEEQFNSLRLCNTLSEADHTELPEEWIDYLNPTAALNAYPFWPELYPPAICPFRDMLGKLLLSLEFAPWSSPEQLFFEAGIPYEFIKPYPLPGGGYPTWFALVGDTTLYAVGYLPAEESYAWQVLYRFDPLRSSPEFYIQDVTGDGVQELAFYGLSESPYACEDEEESYDLFVTTSAGVGLVSVGSYACVPKGETLDLSTYLSDKDGDGLVDWVIDYLVGPDDRSFLTAERTGLLTWFSPSEIATMIQADGNEGKLIEQVNLHGDRSQLREELLSQRALLDLGDPVDRRDWQRITYYIALSYELDGMYDEALDIFFQIIDDGFPSIWQSLSALNIERD